MNLKTLVEKLNKEEKEIILEELVILPTIEEDKSMSQEELGNILRAGNKLGFKEEEIKGKIDKLLKKVGAVLEKK